MTTNNALYQYAPSVGMFHCPGDVRFNLPIGTASHVGWAYDSYAISANVESIQGFSGGFTKITQILRVSDCISFVEQSDTRGFNEATFAMSVSSAGLPPYSFGFEDVFAIYHGNVGTFAFADGHSEARKWLDANITACGQASLRAGSTLFDYFPQAAANGCTAPNGNPGPTASPDLPWLIQHCVEPGLP